MSSNVVRILIVVFVAFALAACGKKDEPQTANAPQASVAPVAQDQYKEWKDYPFADGKFVVKYPADKVESAAPTCQQQNVISACGFKTSGNRLNFVWGPIAVWEPADGSKSPAAYFNKWAESVKNEHGFSGIRDVTVNGIAGKEADSADDGEEGVNRILFIGDTYVNFFGFSKSADSIAKQDRDKFLNSFAVVAAAVPTIAANANSATEFDSRAIDLALGWDNADYIECNATALISLSQTESKGGDTANFKSMLADLDLVKKIKLAKGVLSEQEYEQTLAKIKAAIPNGSVAAPSRDKKWWDSCIKNMYQVHLYDNGKHQSTPQAGGQAPVAVPVAQAPAAQAPAAQATTNLLEQASKCSELEGCIAFMLQGADARKQEVMQMAAARIADFPKPEKGDRKVARDLNKKALELLTKADYTGAIALFQQATGKDPKDVEILSNLGLAFVKAGKAAEAEKALKGALLLEPKRTSSWTPLAEAFDLEGKSDMAVSALLVGYEFSGNKDKTITYYTDKSTTAERNSMKSSYTNALAKIKAQ